jgi:hypothetical protein
MRAPDLWLAVGAAFLVSIWPAPSAAQATLAFGPKQFTRSAGPRQTFTETFQHCGTARCKIVVVNGNSNGSNRVSSASVFLNGREIADPHDFNPHVDQIVKRVTLTDLNHLTVRLVSQPGSFLIVRVECEPSPVVLVADGAGLSLIDPTTLATALTIENTGSAAASHVTVTERTLTGGTLTSPASLPFNLGTIPKEGSAVLHADFAGGTFVPAGSHVLTVKGTYKTVLKGRREKDDHDDDEDDDQGDREDRHQAADLDDRRHHDKDRHHRRTATFCFALTVNLTIPPAAPGSGVLHTAFVPSNQVSGAPFPPLPRPPRFEEEVNRPRWTVPTAPFVPGTPTPTSTGTLPAPFGDPPAIVFNANTGLGLTSGIFYGTASTIAEPSGATGGGVVFATANWTAAYSTSAGGAIHAAQPDHNLPQRRGRILLRSDRAIRAEH